MSTNPQEDPLPAPPEPWRVSLHGGHSSAYCDHATSPLRDILEAAVTRGYHTFGVTEHAPRTEPRFLYPEEIELGWDVPRLLRNFTDYAHDIRRLAREFRNRITVLCGFEIEIVPTADYVQTMRAYRQQFNFDYIVGSVHHVDEILIDGHKEPFDQAVAHFHGVEPLAIRYYQTVADMVRALRPEIVGHLDIIRKNAPSCSAVDTPAIRRAAASALTAIHDCGALLDLNTAGYRKGPDDDDGCRIPYPAPWLVELAGQMGIAFCFGDDSHALDDVGAGIDEARRYLLRHGIASITTLAPEDGRLTKRIIPLD